MIIIEKLELMNKYMGKKIHLEHHIDYDYQICGNPQFNKRIIIDNKVVLDLHKEIEVENISSDWARLKNLCKKYGSYASAPNDVGGGCCDTDFYITITKEMIDKEQV